ncbi:MAG: sodium/proline symporter PutP [Clostridiales Family XIII bacterium]|nr:sodium/proline symporter PutP [Clostridiales Family XIII bacterium]
MSNIIWIIIAFVAYISVMIVIGAKFYGKNETISDYFLGGRKLNAWVAALSAQASDMSGWLLMGLPGAVYAFGTGQLWIAVGLAIGTALNWIFVAKRLRRYTIISGDSITIPEYLENRFHDTSNVLRIAAAIFIAIFFAVYTASAFVAGATLFQQLFGLNYHLSLLIGVVVILVYTFLGGFHAVCWTDLIQGLLMFAAILLVPIIAFALIGDQNALPAGFTDILGDGAGGTQGGISILSQLAWGLGYFGMPHILIRFMAIKSDKTVKRSAAIAIIWVVISLSMAIVVGVAGKMVFSNLENPETVFISLIQKVFMEANSVVPVPIIGGLFLCGILAAIMSTADSQLLVTASSFTSDIYKNKLKKNASERHLLWVSRLSVVAIAAIAFVIATNRDSSVMDLVSNAWAGFGSTFGALILLSIYWRRVNRAGAFAGVLAGGLTVILWDYIPFGGATIGDATGLYSLAIGFVVSLAAILIASLSTAQPSSAIMDEFSRMEHYSEDNDAA